MDKHDGITLLDWLKKEYDEDDFVSILLQLALALHIAQTKSGFVHNDLMPWNIIVQRRKESFEPSYTIFDRVYRLRRTRVYPVIIDYGKAHIVTNHRHHGLINPFKMNAIRDMLMVIFSSISTLVCRKGEKILRQKEEQFLLTLVNFFCPSKIIPQKFHSFTKMRHFINTHSSFSVMTSLDIDEDKNNLEFLQYISSFRRDCFHTAELQAYTPRQKRVQKELPQMTFKNKLLVYHFFQSLNDPAFVKEFKYYLETAKDNATHPAVTPFQIDDELYLNKERFLRMMESSKEDVDEDVLEEKFLVSLVLSYRGVYEVSAEDREKIIRFYEGVDSFRIIHHFANMYTLTDFFLLF
jgi:hypothetical protein